MGTGQMLLTIGAIMLLGTIILSTNRTLHSNSQLLLKTGYGIEEVSLATSIIEEAQGKAFDEHSDTSKVTKPNKMTPPGLLGQENNDPNDLNDFDDYNGLGHGGRMDTFRLSTGTYCVKTQVYYVNAKDLDHKSDQATYSKRLDVWVWNRVDSTSVIKMSTIYSYWYF